MINVSSVGIIFGASSGVGSSTLQLLAPKVSKIFALNRRSLQFVNFENIEYFPCDIREYVNIEEVMKNISQNCKVDFIINCVGVGYYAPLINNYSNNWEDILKTNIIGTTNIMSNILKYFSSINYFINIGSLASYRRSKTIGNFMYSSSKAAILQLMEEFRIELKKMNKFAKVVNLSPGFIGDTEFSKNFFNSNLDKTKDLFSDFTPLLPKNVASVIEMVLNLPDEIEINEVIFKSVEQFD